MKGNAKTITTRKLVFKFNLKFKLFQVGNSKNENMQIKNLQRTLEI
jgi:hypothetical protein